MRVLSKIELPVGRLAVIAVISQAVTGDRRCFQGQSWFPHDLEVLVAGVDWTAMSWLIATMEQTLFTPVSCFNNIMTFIVRLCQFDERIIQTYRYIDNCYR
jgi:hypothetical protein